MPESFDAIVVGAGISGAATAYYLRRGGAGRVLLLERDAPAAGGTGRSAAIVRQHYSTALMARLALKSIGIFERIAEELGVGGVFVQSGYVMLLPKELMAAAERNLALQRSVGVETAWLPEAEWETWLPWLNAEGVGGVIHEPRGGYADSVRSTEAYVAAFVAAGGEFRRRTPCRALRRDGPRIAGVVLDDGEASAGAVVNAAGPWAHLLAKSGGIELPLRVVREQDSIWQLRPDRPAPTTSVSNAVDAIYMRPLEGGRILIGQGFPKDYFDVDPYNYRQTADPGFTTLMAERAERRCPAFAGMTLLNSYAALYDVTPDWYPFVGARHDVDGYFDFNGGSGHGFKIAPAIAEELAELILTGRVRDDFAALSHDRIAAGRLFAGAYGGNRG
jgi:glycine/D-amino acid oxidase-like deaminating enzyme